jgi:ribosomal protein S18 acetylase RimI-like enzyme
MRVRQATGPAEFLESTQALRDADPVGTNILGSIALSVIDGREYEREFWFVAEGDDGEVVGAACWTLPHKLVLGPWAPEVVRAIGEAAAATGVPVHGAIIPVELADVVAEGVGRRGVPYMGERVLALGEYAPPDPVPGELRAATADDVDAVERWLDEFTAEVGLLVVDNRAAATSSIGRLWFWEVDGVAVSMAGHASVVATPGAVVARIGPVYTPPAYRGRRYGSAVTAGVVEHLLPDVDAVMLYADAANPTSNAIYERLGFRHVAEIVDLDLEAV